MRSALNCDAIKQLCAEFETATANANASALAAADEQMSTYLGIPIAAACSSFDSERLPPWLLLGFACLNREVRSPAWAVPAAAGGKGPRGGGGCGVVCTCVHTYSLLAHPM